MIIKSAEFIKSAVTYRDIADFSVPIVAIAGKSNVGKSSFINMLTNSSKLAKVSKDAGRTRMINLFSINNKQFIIADLPGWGYSAAGKGVTEGFSRNIEEFFKHAPNLVHILMLIDVRHEPQDSDKQMMKFMYYNQIPFTVLAVKSDKLSGAKLNPQLNFLAASLMIGKDDIIPVSNLNKTGKDNVLKRLSVVLENLQKQQAEEPAEE